MGLLDIGLQGQAAGDFVPRVWAPDFGGWVVGGGGGGGGGSGGGGGGGSGVGVSVGIGVGVGVGVDPM